MSAQATPETLGKLSDAPPPRDPNTSKAKAITGKSPMRIALGRLARDKIAVICAATVLFFALVAIFAPLICRLFGVSLETGRATTLIGYNGLPLKGPPNNAFDPQHPFGVAPRTGKDNLAYWVYGARTSLLIATVATLFASTLGVILGLLAGFLGGIFDKMISFVTDFFLTVPFLLAALTLAPIISERYASSGEENYRRIQLFALIGVLAVFGWMGVARLIRGEVLSLREREFVMAARVLGMPTRRILVRELLPNLAAPIVVSISLMLPAFVAAEAGLAFLGIGVTSGASWGQTIERAVTYFKIYPLYLWEPLIGIVLLVLALNLLGDAVRDALDPKTRR